jgi:protein-S-isoprenylcysteine O-methyltransferase Ste14
MSVLALLLLVAWLALAAGLRGYLHHRHTGHVAVPAAVERGSARWWARMWGTVGLALAFAAPLADIAGLPRLLVPGGAVSGILGAAVVVGGTVATLLAQWSMGSAWRPDVDADEKSVLITTGPFLVVRNPVLASTVLTMLGLAVMVPNVLSVVMLLAVITSVEIQVRRVEEPYLRAAHGDSYLRYAERTGRFVPWLGRYRPSSFPVPPRQAGRSGDRA